MRKYTPENLIKFYKAEKVRELNNERMVADKQSFKKNSLLAYEYLEKRKKELNLTRGK